MSYSYLQNILTKKALHYLNFMFSCDFVFDCEQNIRCLNNGVYLNNGELEYQIFFIERTLTRWLLIQWGFNYNMATTQFDSKVRSFLFVGIKKNDAIISFRIGFRNSVFIQFNANYGNHHDEIVNDENISMFNLLLNPLQVLNNPKNRMYAEFQSVIDERCNKILQKYWILKEMVIVDIVWIVWEYYSMLILTSKITFKDKTACCRYKECYCHSINK